MLRLIQIWYLILQTEEMENDSIVNFTISYSIDDGTTGDILRRINYLIGGIMIVCLLVGSVTNVWAFVIFCDRIMSEVPAYLGFRLLCVSNLVVLWLYSVIVFIPVSFQLTKNPLLATSDLSCQIESFILTTVLHFDKRIVLVIATFHCCSTCCCAASRQIGCCKQPTIWLWASFLLCWCFGSGFLMAKLTFHNATNESQLCEMHMDFISSTGIAPLYYVSTMLLFALCVILIVQIIFCRHRIKFHIPDVGQDVNIGRTVNIAVLILLIASLYIELLETATVGLLHHPQAFLMRLSISLFNSVKFFIYAAILPEFRRRISSKRSQNNSEANVPLTNA